MTRVRTPNSESERRQTSEAQRFITFLVIMNISATKTIDLSFRAKVEQFRKGLLKADFGSTLDVRDFETFQAHLQQLYKTYSHKSLNKLVTRYLAPCFEHVKSFEKALALAFQQDATASFVWSAALAIIECTCRHTEVINNTFEQMTDFYKSFPNFDDYVILFPENLTLQFILQDLYEIYTNFSLFTIGYISRRPWIQIASNLFSSKSRRSQSAIKKAWEDSKSEFEKTAKLAFRQHMVEASRAAKQEQGRSTQLPPPPKTTNAPKQHNYFVGRSDVLGDLRTLLTPTEWSPGSRPPSCLLHAMGGMGKTQVALGYANQYAASYRYRLWVNAETPTALADSFNAICTMLDLGPFTLDLVHHWLESTEDSWLIVFDNVEQVTIETMDSVMPTEAKSPASAIIFTSQLEELKHRTSAAIPLKSLDSETGAHLLLKCLRRDISKISAADQKILEEISDMLGGHPLALAHIGGYMSESHHNNLAFFRDFVNERWHRYAWVADTLVKQNEKRLEIVWDLALDELPANAHKLIKIMAYLNPDGVPEDWLIQDITEGEGWGFPSDFCRIELLEMTRSLSRRCLISKDSAVNSDGVEQNMYIIHRSLQVALRLKLDKSPEERSSIFNHALALLERVSPMADRLQIPAPSFWPQFQMTNPHVLSLCTAFNAAHPPIQGSLRMATLLYNAGFHVFETWNPMTRDGVTMLNTAEQILKAIGYDGGRLRADISCVMSFLLDILGPSKWHESLARRQEILDMRKALMTTVTSGEKDESEEITVDPESEHMYYNAANDLGLSYLQCFEFEKAEELFVQCFSRYKQWGGVDDVPFEYGKYYHNMSIVRAYQGDYDSAISMARMGSEIKFKTDGNSSRYLWFQYDLACVMLQAGQLNNALGLHLEVLKGREAICGARAEVTLQSLYTVGAMYHHLGDYTRAENYIRRCLDRAKKVRWHDCALARAQFHLARLLEDHWLDQSKGDSFYYTLGEQEERKRNLAEARQLKEQSLPVLDRLFEDGVPAHLADITDKMTLFDSIQPGFEGRWTGRDLLPAVQRARGRVSET
ncbi:hypothetical protein QBC47DRAFT_394042 [Echria macrotheca]|uniref:DUF7779 domain-containing protein n=1 Tax=Echria macrotheca TaxID=438768 RepID=A0AAJ0B5A0_9PEZI|nr:hypothetical protein QBC47DRAFT_394042 [Echria macrotheca]